MNPSRPSTPKISIPKTADGCSPTITSSFGMGISIANLLGVNHFPKGGGIDNQKDRMRKLLINPNSGGGYLAPSEPAITRQGLPTISTTMAEQPTQS